MKKVMHGKTDNVIIIKRNELFKTFLIIFATRYHSLEVVKKNLKNIEVLAISKNKQ